MSASPELTDLQQLLKDLDQQKEAYDLALRKVQEYIASPPALPIDPFPQSLVPGRSPTTQQQAKQSLPPPSLNGHAILRKSTTLETSSGSRLTGEGSDDEADQSLYVQDLLPQEYYENDGLREHLRNYPWDEDGRKVLQTLAGANISSHQHLISPQKGALPDRSHHTHFQIFDIGIDGAPLLVEAKNEHVTNRPTALWQTIKSVNSDSRQRKAVGRISIVREPAPVLFGALHYAMQRHFDVDELFKHLVEAQSTWCDFDRAFNTEPRRQSSFTFCFEYFTLIGEECQPLAWQLADTQSSRNPDHIAITRCSSIVALSLGGKPIKRIRNPDRRAGTTHGFVYDPWGPYHVLNIQCYPDWESSLDVHNSTQHHGMVIRRLL